MELIEFGVITKPQGLKGEFRVRPVNFNLPNVNKIKEVIINSKHHSVKKIIAREKFFIFKLADINSCEEAEDFRNVKIFYEFNEEEPLENGEYYIKDLIGCKLIQDDGIILGEITNILTNSGSTDVICFEKDGKENMFPFVKDIFINVDLDNKNISVSKSRLSEILV